MTTDDTRPLFQSSAANYLWKTLLPSISAFQAGMLSAHLESCDAERARHAAMMAAAQAHIDWQYRMPGAKRFTLTDLRAALASEEPR